MNSDFGDKHLSYISYLHGLSNFDLLDECLGDAGGDDYDGCFTADGCVKYALIKQEVSNRLISCGYIDKSL